MEWWTEARFGMFIHWGLYSLAARHEWVRSRERMDDEAYGRYFARFDPDLYDPRAWARAARETGMKYVVVTTKHHDGFCLWDSKLTDFKATRTPAGRDLIGPLVEALRGEGLRVGFYHSLLDWHHPEYTLDAFHPMRDDPDVRGPGREPRHRRVRRLSPRPDRRAPHGLRPIDSLFLDYSFPGPGGKGRKEWKSERLLETIRRLQPGILVNDRLDLLDVPGGWDYRTPEQFMPREGLRVDGRPVPWETCQTFSGSWGYDRDESTWKSVRQLILMLVETVGKGGNLLLNVGPTGRGTFDDRAIERLRGIGAWMRSNARAVHGCTEAPAGISRPANTLLTYNGKTGRLYVHVLEWPAGLLTLEGLAGRVEYAQLLHDASEVAFLEKGAVSGFMVGPREASSEKDLTLRLPVAKPDVEIPVIELFLKQP